MKQSQLITEINSLSDDLIPDVEVSAFINDAIAIIGQDQYATFPSLDPNNPDDEPVLPDKWQRMLIIPFGKGRVKEKDSSQFEWEAGYDQFYTNLTDFGTGYTIPKQYLDLDPDSEITINGQPYDVQSGDTIHSIAEANSVPVEDLLAENQDALKFVNKNYNEDIGTYSPQFWGNFGW